MLKKPKNHLKPLPHPRMLPGTPPFWVPPWVTASHSKAAQVAAAGPPHQPPPPGACLSCHPLPSPWASLTRWVAEGRGRGATAQVTCVDVPALLIQCLHRNNPAVTRRPPWHSRNLLPTSPQEEHICSLCLLLNGLWAGLSSETIANKPVWISLGCTEINWIYISSLWTLL